MRKTLLPKPGGGAGGTSQAAMDFRREAGAGKEGALASGKTATGADASVAVTGAVGGEAVAA
jgi:hypothetical protein